MQQENENAAIQQEIAIEAKPKLYVIKIGGNVIDDNEALASFVKDFASIEEKKILIHGGGKIATKIGDDMGIESKYVHGRRITDDATIDLVTMVYGGLVNKSLVVQLQKNSCNAIGLTGADAGLLPSVKRPVVDIDYGWVGDVHASRLPVATWQMLLDSGLVPVVAPLTYDPKGYILNTNADTVASSIAIALSVNYDVRLVYCFEKKGVLSDMEDENSVISLITNESYRRLLYENKLSGGILPKVENAFDAIEAGVKEVLIGEAKDLLQNLTEFTKGTLIK